MNQRTDAANRPESTIEAAFSHAEAFDFIDLRLAFDGTAFSSSPNSPDSYGGPWEDYPCEHADFLVCFSSVYCAFQDFVKFLEAIAVGVEQCLFSWDAEGPDGCFSWQRVSSCGVGFLAVTWHSRPSFRYGVRIDGKSAVRFLYGAFREFVDGESYDPVRYERMTIGETLSLVLVEGDFGRLPAELAKLDARTAEALLRIAHLGPGERSTRGPKERHALSDCHGLVADEIARTQRLGDADSGRAWIPAEWDGWAPEKRLEEIGNILGWENVTWHGANLRETRSRLIEAWLENEVAV